MKAKIKKSNVQDILELNMIQEGMLYHYLRENEENIYNVQLSFRIEGEVDPVLLKKAFESVQAGNEVLRSVFSWEKLSRPVQIIFKDCALDFSWFDMVNSGGKVENFVTDYLAADRLRRFDLSQLPLRVSLIRIAPKGYVLVITHHHILYDGWSTGILLDELLETYHLLVKGLQPEPVAKPAYKLLLRKDPVGKDDYWKNYLAGMESNTFFSKGIAAVRPDGPIRTVQVKTPLAGLEAFSRSNKVTPAAVLYAAYGILLALDNNAGDVVFGMTVSDRDSSVQGNERVMGNFINTLPLRITNPGDRSLWEVVRSVSEELRDRTEYNSVSYGRIKQLLGVKPSENLFDSVMVVENYPLDEKKLTKGKDFSLQSFSIYENTGIPMLVTAFLKEELEINLSYRETSVPTGYVKAFAGRLSYILEEIIRNKDQKTGLLSLLLTADVRTIKEANHTAADFPGEETIISLFDQQVKRTPENIALRWEDKTLTFKQLKEISERMASWLKEVKGVRPGDIVAVMMERGEALIPSIFGILRAGAAYLPIDPHSPEERTRRILDDARVKFVFRGEEWPQIQNYEPVLLPKFESSRLAYVIYTSGSTGNPKGVMIEHRSVVNRILWMQKQFPIGYADVILQKTPIVFDVSVWELFWWSFTGASCALLAPGAEKEPTGIRKAIDRHQVTTMHFVPGMLEVFLNVEKDESDASKLQSLRQVFTSGEALKPEHVNLFSATIYTRNGTRLINLYGPTEATVDVSFYECPLEYNSKLVPIGKPIDNTRLYIVNQWLQPVPVGVPGELCIAGVGLARGYLNNPVLTAEKFVDYPAVAGERIYRTGDLAKWMPDGNIVFLGRIDHQVKIRGFRIEPGEIEQALGTYPPVRDCLVADKEKNGEKYLVAYYTAASEVAAPDIRSFLASRLPDYMIPAWFVHLDSFPLNANGKIDRKVLPDPAIGSQEEFTEPSGETEMTLTEIWASILGLDAFDISTTRSFFELGGHSLRATTLVNRINREFGVAMQLNDIFRFPTVRGLAACISTAGVSTALSIPKAAAATAYPLSSIQRRVYFLHQLDKSSLAYNMPYVVRLEGKIDVKRLEKTFQELIARHDIFRTTYDEINQYIAERVDFALAVAAVKEAQLLPAIRSFIQPFDLATAPLLRAGLFTTGPNKQVLVIDMHHIVSDGPSQQIIVRDFMALYNNQKLPALQLQYKDFAVWQATAPASERLSKARDFWMQEFAEPVAALELPADFPRPAVKDFAGASLGFVLGTEETQRLKTLAEAEGSTLFMTLLSIYSILLSKLGNQENIVTGVPVAGREHADLENMIGMFVGTLPIRLQCRATSTFRQLLADVRIRTVACLNNQAYPYESLVEALNVDRDTSRNPLFDVAFFMQNFEGGELSFPGVKLTPYEGQVHDVAKFDLTLLAKEKEGVISFTLEYATSLFKQSTIERFVGYFRQIVGAILGEEDMLVSAISLLDEEESRLLLEEWNGKSCDYDREATIVSLFGEQVLRTPEKTAVVYEGCGLSYRDLDERSDRVAQHLRGRYGVGREVLVGMMLGRSEQLLVGMLGILKAGGAYVPLDPTYPRERLEYMLSDSGAGVVLVDERPEGLSYTGEVVVLSELLSEAAPAPLVEWPPVSRASVELPLPQASDLSYVIYTSGSTGRPKGVMITHGNVVNFFTGINDRLKVGSDERLLAVTSPSFDISVLELFWTLCHGVEIVLHPSDISLNGLDRYVEEQKLSFSLFFFSSYEKDRQENKYDLLLESVKYADRMGFEAVWTPERHFHEFGGLYPNPSVIGSALSMVTNRIGIRSGSVVSPLHDTLRIAEEWSVVDNLSGGRVGLSFASGWNPNDFVLSACAGDYAQRQEKMYRQIEEVRRLWKGEEVKRVNGQGREVGVRIYPRPLQAELPVWVTSAGSAATFESAGKTGANVLTHLLGQDVEMLSANIELYRKARREAGYDEGKVTIMLHTYIGEEIGEVERLVEGPFI
ncbi:MAG TPA: amino acid adenylation domain-containing protein, partial [Puia sp.]